MARAQGARSQLAAAFESVYGTPPGSGFTSLPFVSTTLSSDQPLLASELLGYGRDPLAPSRDAITVDGEVVVPIDSEALGFWLRAAFGDADSVTPKRAKTLIEFLDNPEPGDTIKLDGKTWTFVSGASSGPQTKIGVSVTATVAQLVSDLNASMDVDIAAATYQVAQSTNLVIMHDTAGTGGNAFTVAASSPVIVVRSPTLRGGGYEHYFSTGKWDLPSLALEIGMPEVPHYAMYSGVKVDQISWTMQRSGLLTASVQLVAQGETIDSATQAGVPADLVLHRFGHFDGTVRHNFQDLGDVVSAQVSYSNNLDRIETIRADGKIDGADPSIAALTGTLEMRFANRTMMDQAIAGIAGDLMLQYVVKEPAGAPEFWLTLRAGNVFLSRPRLQIEGPQGIQVTFDWQAAMDPDRGWMATVSLQNHTASY